MYSLNWSLDNQNKTWSIGFKPVTRKVLPFKTEVYEAAKRCADEAALTKSKIVVCFSGGLDSELIVRALHWMDVDFSVVSFVYNDWNNYHDVWHADQCCKELGIPLIKHELDLESFIDNGMDWYCDNGYFNDGTRIYQLLRMEFMKRASQYGDYIIKGSGEQRYNVLHTTTNNVLTYKNVQTYLHDIGKFETGIMYSPAITNSLRFMQETGIKGNPYFFYTTPELVAAYQQIPIVEWSLTQPTYYSNWSTTFNTKICAYHSVYPEMIGRKKYNGFEKVKEEYVKLFNEKVKKFDNHNLDKQWLSIADFQEQLAFKARK